MDRATFESQKAFAGGKKASMQRRCVDNDYTARRMYMITMVTEGRRPLFGKVVGRSDAVEPSAEMPHVELSSLGEAIEQIWQTIGNHHQEVKVVALQMMPDHLHAILFVTERMEKPLGKVLLGVKQACNKAFREQMPKEVVAMAQQHAEQKGTATCRTERAATCRTERTATRRTGERSPRKSLFYIYILSRYSFVFSKIFRRFSCCCRNLFVSLQTIDNPYGSHY